MSAAKQTEVDLTKRNQLWVHLRLQITFQMLSVCSIYDLSSMNSRAHWPITVTINSSSWRLCQNPQWWIRLRCIGIEIGLWREMNPLDMVQSIWTVARGKVGQYLIWLTRAPQRCCIRQHRSSFMALHKIMAVSTICLRSNNKTHQLWQGFRT